MTTFELKYSKFERKPLKHQPSDNFQLKTERVFETLETEDSDMEAAHSSTMIEPIYNRNFGNNFHHQNATNQRQHVHTYTGKYYQYRFFQRPKNFSPPYLR